MSADTGILPLCLTARALPCPRPNRSLVHVQVSAAPPPPSSALSNVKPPRRLVCLAVDVSGSMDCSAANIEGVDITRLQLAVVCLQLTISALGPEDDLALVQFSSRAETVLPPTRMDDAGKGLASAAVANMSPGGTTALAEALRVAMGVVGQPAARSAATSAAASTTSAPAAASHADGPPASELTAEEREATEDEVRSAIRMKAARKGRAGLAHRADVDNEARAAIATMWAQREASAAAKKKGGAAAAAGGAGSAAAGAAAAVAAASQYGSAVIGLFTDGFPEPKLSSFEKTSLLEAIRRSGAAVSTFGFGNEIARELLVELADAGGGVFAHISDSTMALTTFVNFAAAARSTAAQRVQIRASAEPVFPAALPAPAGSVPQPLSIARVWGAGECDAGCTAVAAELGSVQLDCHRDWLLEVALPFGADSIAAPVVSAAAAAAAAAAPGASLAASSAAAEGTSLAIGSAAALTITASVGGRDVTVSLPVSHFLAAAYFPANSPAPSAAATAVAGAAAGGAGASESLAAGGEEPAAAAAAAASAHVPHLPPLLPQDEHTGPFSIDAEVARLRSMFAEGVRAVELMASMALQRGKPLSGASDALGSLVEALEAPFSPASMPPTKPRGISTGGIGEDGGAAAAGGGAGSRAASTSGSASGLGGADEDEPGAPSFADDALSARAAAAAAAHLAKFRAAAAAAVASDPRVVALRDNVFCAEDEERGQVGLSVRKPEWAATWGRTYLAALALAHARQACTNFKDVSLQAYGGDAFRGEQARMEALLQERLASLVGDVLASAKAAQAAVLRAAGVPALPQMRINSRGGAINNNNYGGGGGGGGAGGPDPVDMLPAWGAVEALYNREGGCFSGGSTVTVLQVDVAAEAGSSSSDVTSARSVPLREVTGGMVIAASPISASAAGTARCGASCVVPARVLAVVRRAAGAARLLPLARGCSITPWHPVRCPDGVWRFPAELTTAQLRSLRSAAESSRVMHDDDAHDDDGFIYNLILDAPAAGFTGLHAPIVGGVPAIALGHGLLPHPLAEAAEGAAAGEAAEEATCGMLRHAFFGDRERILRELALLASTAQRAALAAGECASGFVRMPDAGAVARHEASGLVVSMAGAATPAADAPRILAVSA